MTDEHTGQSIYENGRFRLRTETDYAIVDELGDFPPIMITHMNDDGGESGYADRSGVLHLLNELADTNPNEQRHFYLKYRLDRVHDENEGLRNRIIKLEQENNHLEQELDKLKKFGMGSEHIRLSINIETGELQRHIYATGQWFGDFDRRLCTNWINEKDYQKFIDRVIEVFNTEFKEGKDSDDGETV